MKPFLIILLPLFLQFNCIAQLVNDRTGRFDILKPNINQDVNFKAPLLFDPLDCSGLTTSSGNFAYCDNDEFNLFGNLKVDSTGHIQIPVGTTAQRDANPQPGMYRYNSDLETFEGYTTEWGPIAGGGGLSKWLPNEEYEPGKNDTVYFEDNFKIYQTDTLFTAGANFDASNWNELSKSKADSNRILNDPGFEYGVTEWSCTNASVSRVTTNTVNDSQGATEITFSADGGYCELTKDFTNTVDEDQKIITSARVKTADDNVFFSYIKNNNDFKVENHPGDDKYTNFVAQPITQGITGFRITGDNTQTAIVDDAKLELGGLPVGVSKNCADELDCENEFSAEVISTGAVASSNVKWIDDCTITDTGRFTCPINGFSLTPNCTATIDKRFRGNYLVHYYKSGSSSNEIKIRTAQSDTLGWTSQPFNIICQKTGDDYKPLNDRGVVFTESSGGSELVASKSIAQSVGASTVNLEFTDAQILESKYISWNSTLHEATVQKSGKFIAFSNTQWATSSTGNEVATWEFQKDDGSGYSAISGGTCDSFLKSNNSSGANFALPNMGCFAMFKAKKGDKFRVRLTGTHSSIEISQDTGGSAKTTNLTVVPVLGREYVAAETQKKVKTGVEQWHGEYWDGDKVYEYCNEVASDITTSGTIETIDSGLNPVGHLNYNTTTNAWVIQGRYLEDGSSNRRFSSIEYDSSSGEIKGRVIDDNSVGIDIGAGTRYCLKYTR